MSGRFEIRKARPSDAAAVAEFYAGLGRDFSGAGGTILLAVEAGDDGSIVGVTWLDDRMGTCLLRKMHVAPTFQRRGVGRALLRAAVTSAGSTEMWCLPWRHLIDFYAGAGFAVVDPASAPEHVSARLAKYLGWDLDIALMRRDPTQ